MQKFIFIYLALIMQLNEFSYKDYLGKSIDQFKNLAVPFQGKQSETYHITNSDFVLYDIPIREIILRTKKSDTVISLYLSFSTILEKAFYEKMVEEFGVPIKILKQGKLLMERSENNDYGSSSIQQFSWKETKIDDKPIFVLWQMDKFSIQITYNYYQNKTSVQFISGENPLLKN